MRLAVRNIIFSGLALTAAFFSPSLHAQDRCGSVEYNKTLYSNPALRKIEFEQWLTERSAPRLSKQARKQVAPYKIPVVVHIIHNGEPVGTGANIPEAQVLSQLRVLNEDFNRRNSDTVNTPAQFRAVAGSLDIEFILAKQDPEGLATNGIIRVNGGRTGWTMNDNYTLKALSYWPAEQFLNIWVCNLTDSFVGYAQEPESSLPGSQNASTNRLTDGIVVWHKAFGSIDDGPFALDPTFNKGRTGTHEMGHFFGVRHVWGDDGFGCTGTDYVADTPNQAGQTNGCPTHPKTDGCGEVIMFQNFLDYSDDDCMNLFTQGQVDRMVVVLENSPRRNSLLTSPGLLDPAPLPNDLGIRRIVIPDASVCSNVVTPLIELRNYGSNTITSGRIRFILDGTVQETKDFALSLAPLESIEVSFSAVSLPSGTHGVTFQILLTNGGADSGAYNNEKSNSVIVPAFGSAPFAENFSTPPSGWIIQNPDGLITWQIVTAPKETSTNKALKLNYLDYEDKIGEVDVYLSPVIDLSSAPAATLTFDVAHARYQLSNDRLKVMVLQNCESIYQGTAVYDKAGDALKTAPATTQPFVPTGQNQWRKELIDLSAFVGKNKVQIAFVGINDYGNNIYVDNITLFTEKTTDVALVELAKPAVVTCEDQIIPSILIQNAGSELLTEVEVSYLVNGGAIQMLKITDINLPFGEEKELDLTALNLSDGTNTLEITLQNPNGAADFNPGNNGKTFAIFVNKSQDRIPLRENFDGVFTPAWTVVNPMGGMSWETIPTNFGQSLYFNAFNNDVVGDEAWLVSPVLDFSRTSDASMLFDLAYVARSNGEEKLTILGSTDCGTTFNKISYNFPRPDIVNQSWSPGSPEDWNRNIAVNLNSLAGNENVRIAFVVRNENGNNLYLDNIEFFVEADPNPIEIGELYSVYGYDLTRPELTDLRLKFNLQERQDVRFSIITVTGQMETDGILTDVLNQTYPLNLPNRLPPGVYFIRVQIGDKFYTSKILVN